VISTKPLPTVHPTTPFGRDELKRQRKKTKWRKRRSPSSKEKKYYSWILLTQEKKKNVDDIFTYSIYLSLFYVSLPCSETNKPSPSYIYKYVCIILYHNCRIPTPKHLFVTRLNEWSYFFSLFFFKHFK
jgi:hypothetical protein